MFACVDCEGSEQNPVQNLHSAQCLAPSEQGDPSLSALLCSVEAGSMRIHCFVAGLPGGFSVSGGMRWFLAGRAR